MHIFDSLSSPSLSCTFTLMGFQGIWLGFFGQKVEEDGNIPSIMSLMMSSLTFEVIVAIASSLRLHTVICLASFDF